MYVSLSLSFSGTCAAPNTLRPIMYVLLSVIFTKILHLKAEQKVDDVLDAQGAFSSILQLVLLSLFLYYSPLFLLPLFLKKRKHPGTPKSVGSFLRVIFDVKFKGVA